MRGFSVGWVATLLAGALVIAAPFVATSNGIAEILRKRGDFSERVMDNIGADSWLDADTLFELCSSKIERSKNLCHGYIMATADAYNSGGVPWRSCIRRGTDIDYLTVAFVDFMKRHPATGNGQASVVVALLLRDTFPCPPR